MLRISGFKEPFYLQWHITDDCNLKCAHCYRDEKKPSLSEADLLKVLGKFDRFIRSRGVKGRIQFGGGEPFLSKNLFKIISEAKNKKIPTRILSNGTLIDKEMAKNLKGSGCNLVQISIEGDEKIHNEIRGNLSFEKAIEGAKILKEDDIEVTFMMTISRKNYKSLNTVHQYAKRFAKRFSFSRFVPIGQGKNSSKEILSKKELKRFFQNFYKLRKENSLQLPLRDPLWHAFFKKCNSYLVSGCSIGYNGICVDSDGTVYPCRRLPIPLGNILNRDFDEIWNSEILEQLRNRDLLKGRCGDCNLRWQCGGCRAIAYSLTENYLQEDPQCFR